MQPNSSDPRALTTYDIASILFWSVVTEAGSVNDAVNLMLESNCDCLFEEKHVQKAMSLYDPGGSQEHFLRAVRDDVESHVFDSINRHENLNGAYFLDESPLVGTFNTSDEECAFAWNPPRISVAKASLSEYGILWVRRGLPASVFSNRPPPVHGGALLVEDTASALGSAYPLILAVAESVEVYENAYVTSGVFYVPVRDRALGHLVMSHIPNSIVFSEAVELNLHSTRAIVNVELD